MKVCDLIKRLSAMPQDAEVYALYDGFCLLDADSVWLAQDDHVIITQGDEAIYDDRNRPAGAPLSRDDFHWEACGDPRYSDREPEPSTSHKTTADEPVNTADATLVAPTEHASTWLTEVLSDPRVQAEIVHLGNEAEASGAETVLFDVETDDARYPTGKVSAHSDNHVPPDDGGISEASLDAFLEPESKSD